MMDTLNTIIILLQHLLIGIIGSIGNIFVLIVYIKKLTDNEISTLFIVYLAFTDLLCCVLLIPINCYIELFVAHIYSDILCKFHTFLSISNVTFSCLLMTLVAFERYFSIRWPLHRIITKLRAKLLASFLLLVCIVIAVLGSLAVGIDHEVKQYTFSENFTLSNETLGNQQNQFLLMKKFNYTDFATGNYKIIWERTYECFHNDLIITRTTFAYLRLIQNAIPIICFFVIFVLYAAIYISVAERRKAKKDRAAYYKQIVRRSRQFSSTNLNNQTSISASTASGAKRASSVANANLTFNQSNSNNNIKQSFLDIPNNTSNNVTTPFNQSHQQSGKNRRSTHKPVYIQTTDTNNDSNNNQVTHAQNATKKLLDNNEFEMEPVNLYNRIRKPQNEKRDVLSKKLTPLKPSISAETILSNIDAVGRNIRPENAIEETVQLLEENTNISNKYKMNNDYTSTVNNAATSQNSYIKEPLSPIFKLKDKNVNTNTHNNTSVTDLINLPQMHHQASVITTYLEVVNNTPHDLSPDSNKQMNSLLNKPINNINDNDNNNKDINYNTSTLIANIKTAFMLFVVTLIMVVVYTPALLTSFNVIPYNPIYWNLYFINNACNPIVYSFLNANFRNSLKNLLFKNRLNCKK